MDFNEIKKIIEEEKVKVVIANDDGPNLIIMTVEDYRRMKGGVRIEEKTASAPVIPRELESESLKIDDLPF